MTALAKKVLEMKDALKEKLLQAGAENSEERPSDEGTGSGEE